MRILFVSSQVLFRDTRFGGAKRLYYLAKQLNKSSALSLICLDGCNEFEEGILPPREFSRNLFIPNSHDPSFKDRLGFLPDVKRTIAKHRETIRAFIEAEQYDVIVLAFPSALRFISDGLLPPSHKVVYIEDDLLLEQWRKRHDSARGFRKAIASLRLRQGLRYYRKALRSVTDFACISNQELDIVKSWFPRTPSWLLEYGLPLEDYPLLPETGDHPTVGFIGNYHHLPNLDAALWLVRTLFPVVTSVYPHARLLICGTNVNEELRSAISENQAVQLIENVPELATFYREITAFVNPIREGRGLRTKVLEAAAFGRPVVSTPLGAEGLEGFAFPLFEDGASLIEALRSLQVPETRQAISQKNRALVEATYSVEAVVGGLIERFQKAP